MPTIPPDIQTILNTLGVAATAESRWKRLDDWPSRRIRAHYFCDCQKPGERVELMAARFKERAVFVGQCSKCGVVYWRDAVKDA